MQVTKEAQANSGFWLILVAAFAVFALCVLIVTLVIYYHRKQQTLSLLLCGALGRKTTLRKYLLLSLVYETGKSPGPRRIQLVRQVQKRTDRPN